MADEWPKAIEIEPGIGRYADVANTIDQGEPAKAHALLRARLGSATSADEKQQIRRMLDHPVLFAIPITKGPGLGRLNGMGTGLYGHEAVPSADGAYVATRCFSFLWLPLVPIDRYVVRDAEGGGWYFLAKLPLRSWQRALRSTALAALVLVAAAVCAAIWKATTTDDVHVLNGLDVPVHVEIGETTLVVPPGGRAQATLSSGSHDLRCSTADGRVIDEQTVDVDGGHDLVVYNPMGAAPLYTHSVVYSSSENSGRDPRPRVLAGRSWISIDDVDDVFEEPPSSVSTKSNKDVVRVTAQFQDGGWRTSVNWLVAENQGKAALGVAQRVAAAFPDDPEPFTWAVVTAFEHGKPKDVAELAKAGYALVPDDVEAHRRFQGPFQQVGAQDVLLPHYRRRSDADQSDTDAAYLLAQLLPLNEAIPIYEAVLRHEPEHQWSRRGLASSYYRTERFEDALPLFEALPATDPQASAQPVEMRARCLVALNRLPEALGIARSAASQVTPETPYALPLLRLYARVHALSKGAAAGMAPGELMQQRLGKDVPARHVVWVLAQAASSEELPAWLERVGNPIWREWTQMTVTARTMPEQLPAVADAASRQAVDQLSPAALVALICELCRTGEVDDARVVYFNLPAHVRSRLSFEALRELTQIATVDAKVDLEVRAVLWDAKARRTQDPEQRAVMRERAQRLDTLRCVVPR